ncbi:MAG: biopolymer transporter ExbD [Polaromonas sp.]|jgi:biopolymer transport protein ExbD|nr:biopolymer transporter ExbD [Polaromonas sp.]MBK9339744.1 biopolymer transporter ExbD [Rhodoferax sp.]MBK7503403.1 biopolymer transporter ExbD [Polaromonas sp.]MBL0253328.1 biopolymer transporter ExbD [Polaromonas sp.]MBP7308853.1 biopolymer transporter ExbD [Polaromonas sp.]
MAITYKKSTSADDALMADINTTPLVDVMLVLLIIFLITIPAVTTSVQLKLPKANNVKSDATVETIVISLDAQSQRYWLNDAITSPDDFQKRLASVKKPNAVMPAVHIRGDASVNFEAIGKLVYDLKSAGVTNIGFITHQPEKSN